MSTSDKKSTKASSSLKPPVPRISKSVGNSPNTSPVLSRKVLQKQLKERKSLQTLITSSNCEDDDSLVNIDINDETLNTSSDGDDKSQKTQQSCPCNKSDMTSTYIKCAICNQEWHNKCCNLSGVSQAVVKKMTKWQCPRCYVCPYLPPPPNKNIDSSQIFSDFKRTM